MLGAKKAKEAKEAAKKAEAEAEAKRIADEATRTVEEGSAEPTEGGGSESVKVVSVIGGVGGTRVTPAPTTGKRKNPGEMRIQKDLQDLDGGRVAEVSFPDPNDLTSFKVSVSPDAGFWSGARYVFTISIGPDYPHKPPKVTCDTKIYHPNIDFEGAVCLNILRDEWKPVLDINAVIYGLCCLFYEPNPDDPLNKEAAALLRSNVEQFRRTVTQTLQGRSVSGQTFTRLI